MSSKEPHISVDSSESSSGKWCLMTHRDRSDGSVVWPIVIVYSKKLCVWWVDDELLTEPGYDISNTDDLDGY